MKNIEEVIGKHSDSVRGRLVESVAMITKCEDLIVQHYNEDQMKTPMHMSVGDESCVAGVVECFREDSYFFGYYLLVLLLNEYCVRRHLFPKDNF